MDMNDAKNPSNNAASENLGSEDKVAKLGRVSEVGLCLHEWSGVPLPRYAPMRNFRLVSFLVNI